MHHIKCALVTSLIVRHAVASPHLWRLIRLSDGKKNANVRGRPRVIELRSLLKTRRVLFKGICKYVFHKRPFVFRSIKFTDQSVILFHGTMFLQ